MYRSRMVAAVLAALCVGESVQAGEAPKWGAHLDLEGKLGTERHLGEVDLFLPVAQDHHTLLFADIRTRMDDQGSREGNFGLGVRTMLESGWNLGGYGYFDRRRSELDNYFNQVTLGAEALSQDWDLRANGYIPVGRTTHLEDSLNSAEVSGTSVIFRGGEERSLGGFDAEIGWRLPVFEPDAGQQVRVYAGGYRFADDGVPTVAGPRGRAEMVFDEVAHLWDGSRLSLGAEWQRDEVRGSQGFLTARLRIPLQAESGVSRLTPLERRMTDPIVRDIDIVAQAGAFGATETANQLASGGAFTVLNSATTSGANLAAAVNSAGVGSTVLLAGTFATGTTMVSTLANQTLTGTVTVRSASGRTATVNTGAAIQGNNTATQALLINGVNGTIQGLTISNSSSGGSVSRAIYVADGVTGVTIADNVITATQTGNLQAHALAFGNGTSATIRGNSITATGTGSAVGTRALLANQTTAVTVTGNTLSASGAAVSANDVIVLSAGATTFNSGSTSNVRGNGNCSGTALSGSVGFTNGTSCP
ncbi:inverse autotransporter beta domain-containing protein [Magnetospirillum sulfuroxidans]|uniref:Inverse autotransporter beta domain-containing protein n=1 Tax=Magnetospirillum sulfuroxidans TaxID=611300 RepID=A0ABS5IDJ8_9PROT|nr:inverse autotransporter beta domain-containing protein [Magnetospirillum sulfuroxidans]MBR9972252.1 inverse autotransporter beta domain-containing protein [Magnetospirillum sulfuroxidans]